MRSFPLLYLSFFLVFYLCVSIGGYLNIKNIFPKPFNRKLIGIMVGITILITLSFIYLFIFPLSARKSTNYIPYFYFNTLLITDLFFKIPLAIGFIIYKIGKSKPKSALYAGFILSICFSLTLIYGTFIGSRNLKVMETDVYFNNLPAEFENYRIVQISDIHIGSFSKSSSLPLKAFQKVESLSPDLILFTGDLFNNFSGEFKGWEKKLQIKSADSNLFSILGNHDYGNYHKWKNDSAKKANFNEIIEIHKKLGFEMLSNENRIIKKGNDSIFVIGVENWGHPPFPQYADLEKAMKGVPNDAFEILLTHDPAHWEAQIKGKKEIELTLSGHTHGFQFGILLSGIPFSPAWLVRRNWGGLYSIGNSKLYVNSGLGTVAIPWRIDMPAEITVLTLKRIKID